MIGSKAGFVSSITDKLQPIREIKQIHEKWQKYAECKNYISCVAAQKNTAFYLKNNLILKSETTFCFLENPF